MFLPPIPPHGETPLRYLQDMNSNQKETVGLTAYMVIKHIDILINIVLFPLITQIKNSFWWGQMRSVSCDYMRCFYSNRNIILIVSGGLA